MMVQDASSPSVMLLSRELRRKDRMLVRVSTVSPLGVGLFVAVLVNWDTLR
jgi:hypothetical protein